MLTALWSYLRFRFGRRFRSRAALERYQERRLRRHLRWVQAHSPFYRRHWAGHDLADWRRLPPIDKALMMAEFDELNTVGIRKEEALALAKQAEGSRDFTPKLGGITVGLSSGTSGNLGLFLVSERERMAWAGAVLAKLLPGSILERHRIAFFLRAASNLYDSVGQGRLRFAFFDLLEPLEQHLARLEALQPTLLVGPPSLLRALVEGRVQIRPKRIIAVAEVLEEIDRALIEAHFGQRLHQVYQCTEGFLGATCAHGTLHLNEEIVLVEKEYLDVGLSKFVPIVTDLERRTQPIIRYRLNDILTERRAPCPCGSPQLAIERIEGRSDDLFYVPRADGALIPLFPDFISRAVAGASPLVREYKVVQLSPTEIQVELLGDGATEAVASALHALWERVGALAPNLSFVPYQFQPGPRKLRRVERRITP